MTQGSYKVVFDTNILISGHFWKGPPYRCMLAVESGLTTLILSNPILTEFREKLTDKFGVSESDVHPSWNDGLLVRSLLRSKESAAGWRRIPMMTSSSRQPSPAERQPACQETVTSFPLARCRESKF